MIKRKSLIKQIPEFARKELSEDIIERLNFWGNGISFPYKNMVQFRYRHNKKQTSKVINLNKTGLTYNAAVEYLLAYSEHLQKILPNSAVVPNKDKGVSVVERCRKDRNSIETLVNASYHDENGKQRIRSFYAGSESTLTTERLKHALKTAWHFRRLYCDTLNPEVISLKAVRGWQYKKFYE